MTPDEFQEWQRDLSMRVPSLHDYLASLPRETHRLWYADAFSGIPLDDAMAINAEIMRGDHEISGFARDKLVGIFIRRSQAIAYERNQHEDTLRKQSLAAHSRRASGSEQSITTSIQRDTLMGQAYRVVGERVREWKDSHPDQSPPRDMFRAWTDEAFTSIGDSASDDPFSAPRYRCRTCHDTLFVTIHRNGVDSAAICGECEAGQRRYGHYAASKKPMFARIMQHRSLTPPPSREYVEWSY